MSKLETITIDTPSGSSALQIGDGNTATIGLGKSGDTIQVPSGATLDVASGATLDVTGATLSGLSSVSGNTGQFRVYSSSFTLSNSVTTLITGWSEEFDLSNYFASDKYTPTVAGKYFFNYHFRANNPASSGPRFKISIRKNGSEVPNGNGETNLVSGGSYPTVNHSIIIDADGSSDYFDIIGFQNRGGDLGLFDLVFQGFMLSA